MDGNQKRKRDERASERVRKYRYVSGPDSVDNDYSSSIQDSIGSDPPCADVNPAGTGESDPNDSIEISDSSEKDPKSADPTSEDPGSAYSTNEDPQSEDPRGEDFGSERDDYSEIFGRSELDLLSDIIIQSAPSQISYFEEGEGEDESDYYSHDSTSESEFSSSDDEDNEVYLPREENPIEALKGGLRSWSLKHWISLRALSGLLVLLVTWFTFYVGFFGRLSGFLRGLPKDARTLLETSKHAYNIKPIASQRQGMGDYVYFGLANELRKRVDKKYFLEPKIYLDFNVDGIPLFKSSSMCFWPIVCRIFDPIWDWEPFPVAIYCGKGKPASVDEFFVDFNAEIIELLERGLKVEEQIYEVVIRCHICDTPARAFVKSIIGATGFWSCERCTVEGKTVNKRRVFPETDCTPRTDESFLQKSDEHHHIGTSPLSVIPGVLLVSSFVLDFMHLHCLGLMKRLLCYYWFPVTKKKTAKNVHVSPALCNQLSETLENLKKHIPREFPRKPRGVLEFPRYKATEYRFFLLYIGCIALKKILPQNLFQHFLLVHVATRILCTPAKCLSSAHVKYAKDLYKLFFQLLPDLYGEDAQIMNMHNLLHTADDVLRFKCPLDMISSFPFENYLGKMKKALRGPNKPLAQFCRRKLEKGATFAPKPTPRLSREPRIQKKSHTGKISRISLLNSTISVSEPDNFVLTKSGQIIEVTEITRESKEFSIRGKVWQEKKDISVYPCKSSELEEWEISRPADTPGQWSLNQVKSKLMKISTQEDAERHFAFAILHSGH